MFDVTLAAESRAAHPPRCPAAIRASVPVRKQQQAFLIPVQVDEIPRTARNNSSDEHRGSGLAALSAAPPPLPCCLGDAPFAPSIHESLSEGLPPAPCPDGKVGVQQSPWCPPGLWVLSGGEDVCARQVGWLGQSLFCS